ncbi:MAG: hypothetical protein WBA88_19990, partial [Pseudaminobacter sp.]
MAKKIDDTELNGATPVETPQSVENLVAEVVTPKPTRKAKLKAQTALASEEDVKPDYAALGVEETEVETYEKLRLRFKEFGRRSTAQVFECGEVVAELQELTPDQETFAKRAKGVLNLSRRGAENYANVYRHLQPYRDRLVRVAMIASALYDLATAEPEQIEEVLAAREAGQALTGAQIKEMLGKASGPSVSPDDGGPEGLRAATAQKTAFATKLLADTLHQMLRDAHVALEPHHQGKDVVKGKAETALVHPARLADGLVQSLVFSAQIHSEKFPGMIQVRPVVESRWWQLHLALVTMGDKDRWPGKERVGAWLAETVVPELEWAVGEQRAAKAKAVLDERAAAAEAERVKAEQEKARAKAEAKKAREKAKLDKAKAEKRAAREAKALAKLAASQSQEAASIDAADPA